MENFTTIKGKIESIEYRNTAGHEKKVVTVIPDYRQQAFIEFRGIRGMKDLVPFKEGDEVEIVTTLEGTISRNSGIQYNVLVAQEIKIFNPR